MSLRLFLNNLSWEKLLEQYTKITLTSIDNWFQCHGPPEFVLGLPLRGGPDVDSRISCTLIHSLPYRTPCRLFIHKFFFGLLGLHLQVWTWMSPRFRPMKALTLQWVLWGSGLFDCTYSFQWLISIKSMIAVFKPK